MSEEQFDVLFQGTSGRLSRRFLSTKGATGTGVFKIFLKYGMKLLIIPPVVPLTMGREGLKQFVEVHLPKCNFTHNHGFLP